MWEKQTETNGEDEETTRRAASWEEDAEARRPHRAKAEAPPSAAVGNARGAEACKGGGGRGAQSLQAVRIRQRHQTPGRHWSCALVGGTGVGSGRTGGHGDGDGRPAGWGP